MWFNALLCPMFGTHLALLIPMKTTLLIIHGAGPRSYKVLHEKWVPFMSKSLGPDYHIIAPQMPHPELPQYALWKDTITKNLKTIKGPIILVGHSLGGTILMKYLTEENVKNNILAFYTIASPYFGPNGGWNYHDFYTPQKPSELLLKMPVYSYHSSDDAIVPFSHQGLLTSKLLHTVKRTFPDQGHEFNRRPFIEIIDDIKKHDPTASGPIIFL